MPKLGDIVQGNKVGYAGHEKRIWSACSICGKERWVRLCYGRLVNIRCKSCAKSGENHPLWKGGKGKDREYVTIWQPNKKPRIREHRLIMERHLGRKLNHDEVVHHINNDTLDNRIENLILFKNDNEHKAYHYIHRRTSNRKKYQAQYYKKNLERLKKYKKLWYIDKHKKEET